MNMYFNSETKPKSRGFLDELMHSQPLFTSSAFLEHWASISYEEKEALTTLDEKEIIDEFLNALYDFSSRTQSRHSELSKTTYNYSQQNKPSMTFSVIHLDHLSNLFDDPLHQVFVNSAVILQLESEPFEDTAEKNSQNVLSIDEKRVRGYINDINQLERTRLLFKIKYSHVDSYIQTFDTFGSFGLGQETIIRRDQYKNYFSGSYVNAMMQNYNFASYNRKDPTICQLKLKSYLDALLTLIGSNLRRNYWKNVPGSMEYLVEQIPVRNSPPLTQPVYYNNLLNGNGYPYFQPQRRDQYCEGIHIGRLSFVIYHETAEEDAYTGNGTNSQATTQGMDALEFLLGSQNPVVIRNQQEKLAKINREPLPGATSPKKNTASMQPPLLQDVINFGVGVELPLQTQPLTPQGGSNFSFGSPFGQKPRTPSEEFVKKQNDLLRTPEKKTTTYAYEPKTPEKIDKPFIFPSSMLATPPKKLSDDSAHPKQSGKPQKKLKYKANDYHGNGNFPTVALSFYPGNGNSLTPGKYNSSPLLEGDNRVLFPPMTEANKQTVVSPKNKI